jgi:two-component system sensor histidine kinase VicK
MGTLAHANHAGHDLLPGVEFEAARLADVLGILQLQYDEVMALVPGDLQEATCEYGEYMLSACITPYTSQAGEVDGYVIVLQDITRQTKLDNMRKEFVANVSHELRTPLTSIRTYAETLLEGAMDDKETAHRFLSVIEQESRRMTLLVSDLLELSRIDAKGAMPETEIIDLAAILRLSIRQSHIAAEQQQQRIEFDAPATPCLIDANAARVNQVIYNILSNSIKYSPENTTITIGLDATKKFFHVNITDQGIGIPQEDLSRIFERFYRVDKARARAMGGTGLGLAIVKEIMEEHGGRVYAMSKPGEGTTMMLRFNRMGQGK